MLRRKNLILFLATVCLIFATSISSSAAEKPTSIDRIVVEKSKRTLTTFSDGKALKTYKISLGFKPKGHKQQEGDGKTPEGTYTISGKNPGSSFYRSLRVSYPSPTDHAAAKKQGVNPGGDIMVHGLGKEFAYLGKLHTLHDWTLGCIALTNDEIKEIYDATPAGTPIEIKP